jgi:hypothetical protein
VTKRDKRDPKRPLLKLGNPAAINAETEAFHRKKVRNFLRTVPGILKRLI